jgi:hypothetical protein
MEQILDPSAEFDEGEMHALVVELVVEDPRACPRR